MAPELEAEPAGQTEKRRPILGAADVLVYDIQAASDSLGRAATQPRACRPAMDMAWAVDERPPGRVCLATG